MKKTIYMSHTRPTTGMGVRYAGCKKMIEILRKTEKATERAMFRARPMIKKKAKHLAMMFGLNKAFDELIEENNV